MTLLEASGLGISLGGRRIFSGLDFTLARGEVWGILGSSGAGKTTLLHALAGLKTPDAGVIRIGGVDIRRLSRRSLARKTGVLFQDSLDSFPASVMETVLAGRYPHLPFWAFESRGDVDLARAALQAVSLESMADRQVDTLSGGERRRAAIAALLVQAPEIWLLDEPANHLDMRYQVSLLGRLLEMAAIGGGGTIMVQHDVNLAARFCTHALLMMDDETRIGGPAAEVLNVNNLQALYRHPVREVRDGGVTLFYPA